MKPNQEKIINMCQIRSTIYISMTNQFVSTRILLRQIIQEFNNTQGDRLRQDENNWLNSIHKKYENLIIHKRVQQGEVFHFMIIIISIIRMDNFKSSYIHKRYALQTQINTRVLYEYELTK